MRKATNELLSEIKNLIRTGMTQKEVANKLTKEGKRTPNGKAWTQANVSHYILTHRLNRTELSHKEEKIRSVLGLGLSKETMIMVLTEVL